MKLPNRDGTPVDPVPFLVVALLGVVIALSWGPVYLLEFSVALRIAVTASIVLAAASVIVAYYWFVWTNNPTVREEVPAHVRFRKFLYAIICGVIVVLALVTVQFVFAG